MSGKVIAVNRKARFSYFIEDSIEAGIILTGTEVKSLREGRANIAESYAAASNGELWLLNATIQEYRGGNRNNHEPRRRRKLLLHRREMARLVGKTQQDGLTLVPLKLYFNSRGIAKVELGIARGKKLHDKRQAIKDRDWQRDRERLMRDKT